MPGFLTKCIAIATAAFAIGSAPASAYQLTYSDFAVDYIFAMGEFGGHTTSLKKADGSNLSSGDLSSMANAYVDAFGTDTDYGSAIVEVSNPFSSHTEVLITYDQMRVSELSLVGLGPVAFQAQSEWVLGYKVDGGSERILKTATWVLTGYADGSTTYDDCTSDGDTCNYAWSNYPGLSPVSDARGSLSFWISPGGTATIEIFQRNTTTIQPAPTPAPVPAAGLMLVGGIGMLAWRGRRRG